jgi:hypothetical protein
VLIQAKRTFEPLTACLYRRGVSILASLGNGLRPLCSSCGLFGTRVDDSSQRTGQG